MVASFDLKGLGPTDGLPVSYHWTPPNPLPRLLPWLAVLGLLMLKPNRTGKAWWILVPLGLFPLVEMVVGFMSVPVPSEAVEGMSLLISSGAFSLAAVWLLGSQLAHRLRFLVFLKLLGVLLGVSVFACFVRHDWQQPELAVPYLVMLGLGGLVICIGLSLAGLACRRRYRPMVLLLWLALFTAACWLLVTTPFAIIVSLIGRGGQPWYAFSLIGFMVAGFTFVAMLPFLVLAFANGLYRERLKDLLHLRPVSPPPEAVSPPPVLGPQNQI